MKLSVSILTSLLAAQEAGAFSSGGYLSKLQATATASVPDVPVVEGKAAPVAATTATEDPTPLMDVTKDFNEVVEEEVVQPDPRIYDPKYRVQTGRYDEGSMSISVPFLKRPSKLDGTHAGDVGFDPLGLSETNDLYVMMESELRHARLAMLAVIGWPLSELNAPNFMLHGPNHLAPSVLNGFDPLNFIGFAAAFGALGYFEFQTAFRRVDDKRLGKIHTEDMANVWKYGVPGDYDFDPLNLYSILGDTADGRKALREAEVAHGRAAMLGITYFAAWEALTGHPIVENSVFFHPNAVLPGLALAYAIFFQFYEIKSTEQYMFQPVMTSEGKVYAERLKNFIGQTTSDGTAKAKEVAAVVKDVAGVLSYTANDISKKIDEAEKSYTEFSMRNYFK